MRLLEGKKAVITGSSRGIGRAAALAMVREGASVAVTYNRSQEMAEALVSKLRALGGEALLVQADLEKPEGVDQLFDTVEDAWGELDIFMANAAATAFKQLEDMKPYHLSRTYDLLVQGLVQSVQRCLPLMEGREGRVITMTGHGTSFTLPYYASIGSAKAAVETITRYLAYELGERGITCNAIAPGVVATDSARYYMGDRFDAFNDEVSRQTPLGRLANPADVADVAVFLASNLGRFVTGQTIVVDGGLTLTSGPFEAMKQDDA